MVCYFQRIQSPVGQSAQYCASLFGVSLYRIVQKLTKGSVVAVVFG